MYPLISELAADGIPVVVSCRVLKLARQPYYRWLKQPVSDRFLRDAHLANTICNAHSEDPEFGYRLLADQARRSGHKVCDRTVWRVCASNQWWAVFAKPKTRKSGSAPRRAGHEDLVQRKFCADKPNQLWLTDLTEHRTREGKLYLCAVKDIYSNRIVGYSISDRMKAQIVVAAINNAARQRGDIAGCVLHSDRGAQFGSLQVQRVLDRYAMVGSMGKVGSAGDNAAMESFFSLLQKNVLNRQHWATRQELRIAIMTWIERTYHRRRPQIRLGRLTPIEYETIMTPTATLAA